MSTFSVPVVKIKNIMEHPNADSLSICEFDDLLWACIVKNDEFKVGDTVVYVPVDSVIPQSVIEKYNIVYLKNGDRVRAVKLRGVLSYGFVIANDMNAQVGENLAEPLGITHYEQPIAGSAFLRGKVGGRMRKQNGNFDKYTDIENINNYSTVFMPGDMVVVTEQIHGMNARFGWVRKDPKSLWDKFLAIFEPYEFIVGSHNCQISASDQNNIFNVLAKYMGLKEKLKHMKDYVFYGELYGKGVQKNMEYGIAYQDIRFFDIKYKDRYLDYEMATNTLDLLGFESVPLIHRGAFDLDLIRSLATGESLIAGHKKEGVVVKSAVERWDHKCGRAILKVINPDYLLDKHMTDFH